MKSLKLRHFIIVGVVIILFIVILSRRTKTVSIRSTLVTNIPRRRINRTLPILKPIHVCGNASDLVDLNTVRQEGRPKVDVFINMPVAGHHFIRRKAIRETWLSTAKNYSLAYRFFTDGIGIEPEQLVKLKKEQEEYQDLELIPTKQGYWFSHRFLFGMFWGYEHYDFLFYFRVDDDYFVCLNNLMNDIQYRKDEQLLYWGWLDCDPKMVAIDEGFLLTSVDLVEELIKRNNSMCCHPMGGQMVAMWVNRLEHEGYDVTYFGDNSRLKHYRKYLKKEDGGICKSVIGIHESYPVYMYRYWNITNKNWFTIKSHEFVQVERKEYSAYCKQPRGWDWTVLSAHWKHEPKPCWQPGLEWPELKKFKSHKGRE